MLNRKPIPMVVLPGAVIVCMLVISCSSSHPDPTKLPSPAKVENAVKEPELATIKLTPEAEKRLKIETVAIEFKDVARTLDINGEVVIPEGQTILVSAPMAGTLQFFQNNTPIVGSTIRKGQPLFRLTPFVAPERDLRVQLERDVASLTERVAGLRLRKERAEILARERAGSVRAFEEARADLGVAEAELKSATERLAKFDGWALASEQAVDITAPIGGVIQKVSAGAGQATTAGAALVEISNLSTVWIRVPVYVGDLPQVSRASPTRIRTLTEATGSGGRIAVPVQAPPTADPVAATADLYYALSNEGYTLRPGQRVGVSLRLRAQEASLVIPWAAVLHDIQGATWVYENTAPQTFVRRPVEVRRVLGELAVLGRGPGVGLRIVTAGAAELFGTEFGAGK